jgi:hypothetical protein
MAHVLGMPSDVPIGAIARRNSHKWRLHPEQWYVEERRVNEDLFRVEQFVGPVWDFCAGEDRIPEAARAAGLVAFGTDIVPRAPGIDQHDALLDPPLHGDVVTNPPYSGDCLRQFTERACAVTAHKACILAPFARLVAAHWLDDLPLARVRMISPRPSMPPGDSPQAAKPSGGRVDYCWLVFIRGHRGPVELTRLPRRSK